MHLHVGSSEQMVVLAHHSPSHICCRIPFLSLCFKVPCSFSEPGICSEIWFPTPAPAPSRFPCFLLLQTSLLTRIVHKHINRTVCTQHHSYNCLEHKPLPIHHDAHWKGSQQVRCMCLLWQRFFWKPWDVRPPKSLLWKYLSQCIDAGTTW